MGRIIGGIIPRYPCPTDQSGNTRWTESPEAKMSRVIAMAISCRDLLDQFPDGERVYHYHSSPTITRAWREVVRRLQVCGLLSPNTGAIDVRVPGLVVDARRWINEQAQADLLLETLVDAVN